MSEFKVTYETYHKKNNSEVSGIAAKFQDEIIGQAEFQIRDDQLILNDIYVAPGFRRNGIGTTMLSQLASLADFKHLDFLFSFESIGMKDSFYRFLASTHLFYLERQKGAVYSLSVEVLKQLCNKYPKKPTDQTLLFFERPHMMREEFIAYLKNSYSEIAWELKYRAKEYREDLCCCTVANGQIQGVCLLKEKDGELELKLLFGRSGQGAQAAKALIASIGELGTKEILPMKFSSLGEASMKIVEKMCPLRNLEKWVYVAYYKGKPDRR